ncbi:DUF6185 family protein [Streptomyces sp. NPDC006134]|uniref:DUF6185 family protein n=1 Tax=Streptomyces sp. NPDC006134 TaxID=3154467 RepID=UPI003402D833
MTALAALWCVLAAPAPAHAAERADDVCAAAGLAGARVGTAVRFQHGNRTYTKVTTELTVDVPAGWKHAGDLLLGEGSRAYGTALSCLTRREPGQHRRWTEWRPGQPVVTAKGDRVRVAVKAHTWVSQYRSFIEVGIWRVQARAELWNVTLQPPPALKGAHWDKIVVDPGAVGAETAKPRPTTGEGASALVWRPAKEDGEQRKEDGEQRKADGEQRKEDGEQRKAGAEKAEKAGAEKAEEAGAPAPPAVTVSLRPPWQRSWAAQGDRLIAAGLDRLGSLLWVSAISGLLLAGAFRYRRRPPSVTAAQHRTLRNLVEWAVAVVALSLLTQVDDLMRRYEERQSVTGAWLDEQILRGHVFALAAAVLLFCHGRPPARFWAAGGLLALPPLVTMSVPEPFGLRPSRLGEEYRASGIALAAETTAACCVMALTVLGFVTVAWRLAADGGLLPPSRRLPGRARALRLRVAGPAVGAWTVVLAVCGALAVDRNWRRATWLSDRTADAYGIDHRIDFLWEAVWSLSGGQEWIVNYGWMLTSVAVLAVLRTWRASLPASSPASAMSPLDDRADRLLFLTFFPLAVGIGGGYHLASALPWALWIPVYMLALYGAATLFAKNAVLAQPLVVSGRPLATEADAGARAALLEKSRHYRETHAELRRLDQGLFGDVPPVRKNLERKLDKLHDWPTGGSPALRERLPAQVSVVDAALALGPRDEWWANGVRGARFALLPGVPAAVLGMWADWVRGEAWQDTLGDPFGLPGMALGILYWLVTWVGAGFVLGALWRVLPGRRGAAKALPVAAAFALPVGLDALVGWFTREGSANLALYASTMLLVLTVTGIALDLDTFQGERRYWQTRLGLLLSVYQMRYYSLQVAYLIAQVIAVISIWQFFAEPSASPPSGDK